MPSTNEERYQQLILKSLEEVKANQDGMREKLHNVENNQQALRLDFEVHKNSSLGVPEALDRITGAITDIKVVHGKLNPDNMLQRIASIEIENATRKGKEMTFAGFTGIIGGIIVGLFQHFVLGKNK